MASLYEKVTLDIKHVRELLQREFAIEDSEFELNSRDVSCIDEAIGCLQIIPDLVYLRLRMINFYRSISNSGGVISDFEKKLFDANEVSSALISMLAHKSFSMYIKHFFFEVDIYRGLLEVENHLENFRYLETIIQITITRQKLGEWQDEMSKCHSQYIHDNFFKLTKKLLVPSIFLWFSSAFSSQLGRATLFFHCILKDHAVSLNESLAFLWKSQKTDYIGWIENAVSKFNATSFMLCLDSRNLSHVTLDDKKHPKGYELPLEIDSSNQESVADENLAGLDRFPFVYNHPESRDLREFKADIVSLLFQIEENSSRDKVYHFRENARFRRTYLMCQMSKNITAVLVFSESKSRKSCLEAIEFLMKLGKKLRITSAVKHLVTRNPNSSLVVDLSVLTKHL